MKGYREDPSLLFIAMGGAFVAAVFFCITVAFDPLHFVLFGKPVGGQVFSFTVGFTLFLLVFSFVAYAIAKILYFLDEAKAIKEFIEDEKEDEAIKKEERERALLRDNGKKEFSGLALGYSAGLLYDRAAEFGIPPGEAITLPPDSCCQNIFIAGGIGQGKTTALINPILLQIFRSDCSAIVFDVKGDFRREVDAIAKLVGRDYKVIGCGGDGSLTINLFRDVTPELASSYLKSCFVARGGATGDGAFWTDTAVEYCRELLHLIELTAPEDYSIAGLSRTAFSSEKKENLLKIGIDRAERGEFKGDDLSLWNNVFDYFLAFAEKDEKLKSNILVTLESVLSQFSMPEYVRAFSSAEETQREANFDDLLNEPTIFLVQLPRTLGEGARWANLLIKLRFFTAMVTRRSQKDVNQSRHVAFFADEYQEIVDAVTDPDFWAISRASKCFGVVSMQGVASLINKTGAIAADAILQNWRQKIMLLTEDKKTIEVMQALLGKGDARVYSVSDSQGKSVSPDGKSRSQSENKSQSATVQQRPYIDLADIRALTKGQAVLHAVVGHEVKADVIDVLPLSAEHLKYINHRRKKHEPSTRPERMDNPTRVTKAHPSSATKSAD
ncbi:MAG: type IV secretion system DNA-binding domain-containing protein [Burkholderiales bacterium]|jgi:type IV secretory pathway TraG/TraD family ATPase VirD4|nr:type IV secretion system DNA-binding domain-containing protein [Burkholderiales bacterium]